MKKILILIAWVFTITAEAQFSIPTTGFTRDVLRASNSETAKEKLKIPVDEQSYAVEWFGASTNSSDNSAAIQAALDAAGNGGKVFFLTHGTFTNAAPIRFHSGQWIEGASGGPQTSTVNGLTNQTEIYLTGGGTNSVLMPYDPSTNTHNVVIKNLKITGSGESTIGVNFYRTSYSQLERVAISGANTGLYLDANTANQCYFNSIKDCKIAYNVTRNVLLDNGANANNFWGGFIGGDTPTGVELLNSSVANTFNGVSFQGVGGVVNSWINRSTAMNSLVGCYFEQASDASIWSDNSNTFEVGSTFGGSIATPHKDESKYVGFGVETGIGSDHTSTRARFGTWVWTNIIFSATQTWDLTMMPVTNTQNVYARFQLGGDTTGESQWKWYKGSENTVKLDLNTGAITATNFVAKTKLEIGSTIGLFLDDSTFARMRLGNWNITNTTLSGTRKVDLTIEHTGAEDVSYNFGYGPSTSGLHQMTFQDGSSGYSSLIDFKLGTYRINTPTGKLDLYDGGYLQRTATGVITVSDRLAVEGAFLQSTDAISGTSIDWSTGNTFSKTLAANTTFTFTGATAGQWITVKATNSGTSYTVTWPTVTWQGGVIPTMTASKTDFYTFYYDGTTYFGTATQNF